MRRAGVADHDGAGAGDHARQAGEVGGAAEVDAAARRDERGQLALGRPAGDHDPAAGGGQLARPARRCGTAPTPEPDRGAGMDDDVRRRPARRQAPRCTRSSPRRSGGQRRSPLRAPGRATARPRARRRRCGGAGPAARPGSRPTSRRSTGTPASRSSSAVGSGLWWNEPKTIAMSARTAATRSTSAATSRARRPDRLGVDPRRPPADDLVDARQQLGRRPPARPAQQRHVVGTGREGADRRPGEQHVAGVVEPDGEHARHRRRLDPGGPAPVGSPGCRPSSSRSTARAQVGRDLAGAAATSSGRVRCVGHEHAAGAGRPRRVDVGADVADHCAAARVDARAARRLAGRGPAPACGTRSRPRARAGTTRRARAGRAARRSAR